MRPFKQTNPDMLNPMHERLSQDEGEPFWAVVLAPILLFMAFYISLFLA